MDANGGQIWGDGRQKGAFRAVASQKKICLLEHQNAFAAIQSTFIGIIFLTILIQQYMYAKSIVIGFNGHLVQRNTESSIMHIIRYFES